MLKYIPCPSCSLLLNFLMVKGSGRLLRATAYLDYTSSQFNAQVQRRKERIILAIVVLENGCGARFQTSRTLDVSTSSATQLTSIRPLTDFSQSAKTYTVTIYVSTRTNGRPTTYEKITGGYILIAILNECEQ